jgi:hypothetical protein
MPEHEVTRGRTRVSPDHELARRYPSAWKPDPRKDVPHERAVTRVRRPAALLEADADARARAAGYADEADRLAAELAMRERWLRPSPEPERLSSRVRMSQGPCPWT